MGICSSVDYVDEPVPVPVPVPRSRKTVAIGNHYETIEDLNYAIRQAGVEGCSLIFAFDFTKSNTWQGAVTFDGKSLHHIDNMPPAYNSAEQKGRAIRNPYQNIITTIGNQLDSFDDDGKIPTIIFGHAHGPHEPYIKPIGPTINGRIASCDGVAGILEAYENAVMNEGLSGPTFFEPIIDWAVNIVTEEKSYHILVIIGDGCIKDMEKTRRALARACSVPLSIVFVGVGDGSDVERKDKWYSMRKLDDEPLGTIDNWQSVYMSNIQHVLDRSANPSVELATLMLMEIPEQYRAFGL